MRDLKLYYSPSCPYCQKVLKFMRSASIDIMLKNTLDDKNRNELMKIGGKGQIPCLVIDGNALFESDDIIQWLKDNYKKT